MISVFAERVGAEVRITVGPGDRGPSFGVLVVPLAQAAEVVAQLTRRHCGGSPCPACALYHHGAEDGCPDGHGGLPEGVLLALEEPES